MRQSTSPLPKQIVCSTLMPETSFTVAEACMSSQTLSYLKPSEPLPPAAFQSAQPPAAHAHAGRAAPPACASCHAQLQVCSCIPSCCPAVKWLRRVDSSAGQDTQCHLSASIVCHGMCSQGRAAGPIHSTSTMMPGSSQQSQMQACHVVGRTACILQSKLAP